jgi:predicted amino acid-binding ACT domain protein
MSRMKRIVVTVENEIGVLTDITRVLAEGGINLEDCSR